MEQVLGDVGQWPSWMILIVVCLVFVKDVFEMVFKFIGKQNRREDDEPVRVSHNDIYLRLGEGAAMMKAIKEDIEAVGNDVGQLKQSLLEHAQSDANFANNILGKLNLVTRRQRGEDR